MSDRFVIVRVTDPEVEEVSVLAWRNREEAQNIHSGVRMDEWIPVPADDTLHEAIDRLTAWHADGPDGPMRDAALLARARFHLDDEHE